MRTMRALGGVAVLLAATGWGGAQAPPATTPLPSHRERGVALYQAGQLAEARKALGKAVLADPADATAHAYLGLVLSSLDHDHEAAVAHLEKAVTLEPGSSRHHQWLGQVLGARSSAVGVAEALVLVRRARQELEQAVALDAGNVEARGELVGIYLNVPASAGGSLAKAREQALAITALDRYHGLLAQARVAEKQDDLAGAERLLRSAVTAEKVAAEARNSLGYLLLKARRRDEAVAVFREAVAVAPGEANAHDSLAEGLLAAGEVDESMAEYRRALELDPSFASAHLGLGRCHEERSQWPAAREAYRRCLELAGEGPVADDAQKRLDGLAGKQ